MKTKKPENWAWGVLLYTLLVIVWGAYVRASGSGAGCGEHWPLCNGEFVPRAAHIQTRIEFFHRLTSGLNLILVLILSRKIFKAFPKKSLPRVMAILSIAFILSEALVGAGLVLFGLVAENKSMIRGMSLGIHLTNTFLLLAALLGTALSCQIHPLPQGFKLPKNSESVIFRVLAFGSFIGAILIGVSGAVAALGDTLFPALSGQSLGEAIRQDFNPASHWLIRLRVLHPTIAICGGVLILIYSRSTAALSKKGEPAYRWSLALSGLILIQWTLGFLNVALRAPTGLQLVHLFLADLIWLTLCGMSFKYLTNKVNY